MRRPLSLLLIATLASGQDPAHLSSIAKALIEKPRLGVAEITWQNGAQEKMYISRVTDRFISVDQRGTCQNVELLRIAKIKWPRYRISADSEGLSHLLLFAPIIPFLLVSNAISSQDPKLGNWESIGTLSNGATERVAFNSNGYVGKGTVRVEEVFLRTGRYRIGDGKLYTRYDDGDIETAVAVRFECNKLIFSDGTPPMTVQPSPGHAEAPIVGHWIAGYGDTGPDARVFRKDGTFETGKFQRGTTGSYEKGKGGINTFLYGGSREKWQIRTAQGSLFIARDGKITQFKRRPSSN